MQSELNALLRAHRRNVPTDLTGPFSFFVRQLTIGDFNDAWIDGGSRLGGPVIDMEDLLDLREGLSFLDQSLDSCLFFFDDLNIGLDILLRNRVAVAVEKNVGIQLQDGLQDFDQSEGASILVEVDQLVPGIEEEVAQESDLFSRARLIVKNYLGVLRDALRSAS